MSEISDTNNNNNNNDGVDSNNNNNSSSLLESRLLKMSSMELFETPIDNKSNNKNIDKLVKSLESMHKRVNEVSDVRSYVTQMNDIMTDEIFFSLSSFALKLRQKIDLICNSTQDKLKNYNDMLKEKQDNVFQLINQTKGELNTRLASLDLSKVSDVDELINWGAARKAEIEAEIEGNFKHSLYPKFSYTVPVKKLEEFIETISTEIRCEAELNANDLSIEDFEKHCGKLFNIDNDQEFDCVVTCELSKDGIYWTQIKNNNQVFSIIDEISKAIHRKRVIDPTWLTYAEIGTSPYIGQTCYFFEKKSRKWLRAKIETFEKPLYGLRYLDIGTLETVVTTTCDNILPALDFSLSHVPFQALQCTIINPNEGLRHICVEAQQLFNKLVLNKKHLKCVLKDRVLDCCQGAANCDLWYADLHDDCKMINQFVLEKNDEINRKQQSTPDLSDLNLSKNQSESLKKLDSILDTTATTSNTQQTETDKSISSNNIHRIMNEIVEQVASEEKQVSLPQQQQQQEASIRKLSSAQSFDNLFKRASLRKEEDHHKSVKDICDGYDRLSRSRDAAATSEQKYKRSKSEENTALLNATPSLVGRFDYSPNKPYKSIPVNYTVKHHQTVEIDIDKTPIEEEGEKVIKEDGGDGDGPKKSLKAIMEVTSTIAEDSKHQQVQQNQEKKYEEESSQSQEGGTNSNSQSHSISQTAAAAATARVVDAVPHSEINTVLSNLESNNNNNRFKKQSQIPVSNYNNNNNNNRKNQPKTQSPNVNNNSCKNDSYNAYGYNNRRDDDHDGGGGGDYRYPNGGNNNNKRYNSNNNNNNGGGGGGGGYYGNGYNNSRRGGGGGGGSGYNKGRHHNEEIIEKNYIAGFGDDENIDEVFTEDENEGVANAVLLNTPNAATARNYDYIEIDIDRKMNDLNKRNTNDDLDLEDIYQYNLQITNSYDENLNARAAGINNTTVSSRSHDDGFIEDNNMRRAAAAAAAGEKSLNKSKSHPNIGQKPAAAGLEDTMHDMSDILGYDTTYDGGLDNYRHTETIRAITNNKNNTIIKKQLEEEECESDSVRVDDDDEEEAEEVSNESFVSCQSKQPSPRNLEDSRQQQRPTAAAAVTTTVSKQLFTDKKIENFKKATKNFTVSIFIDSIEENSYYSNDETRSFVVNKSDQQRRNENDDTSTTTGNMLERSLSSILLNKDMELHEFEHLESHYLANGDDEDKIERELLERVSSKPKQYYNEVYASTPIANTFNHLDEYLKEQETASNKNVASAQTATTTANAAAANNCLSTITECSNETFETFSNQSNHNANNKGINVTHHRNNSESTVVNHGSSKQPSDDDDDWNTSDKLSIKSGKHTLKVLDDESIDKTRYFMMSDFNSNLLPTKRGEPGYSYAREICYQMYASKQQQQQQQQSGRINTQLINNAIANLENDNSDRSSSTKLTVIKSSLNNAPTMTASSTSGSEEIKSTQATCQKRSSPKYDEFIKAHENILANFNAPLPSSRKSITDSLDDDNVFYAADEEFAANKRMLDNYTRKFSDYMSRQEQNNLTKSFSNSMSTNICNNRILSNDNQLETPKQQLEKSFLNQTMSAQSIDKTANNSSGTLGISTMTYNTSDSLYNANLIITPLHSDMSAPGTPYLKKLHSYNADATKSSPSLPSLPLPPPPPPQYLERLREQSYYETPGATPGSPPLPTFPLSYIPPTPKSGDSMSDTMALLPPTPPPPSLTTTSVVTPTLPPPPPPAVRPAMAYSPTARRTESIRRGNNEAREKFFKDAIIDQNLFMEESSPIATAVASNQNRDLGRFTMYGLDETDMNDSDEKFYRTQINIETNRNYYEEPKEEEEEHERKIEEFEEQPSYMLSPFPPPPTEFQTTTTTKQPNYLHHHHHLAATTSSSSTATTCRLNTFLKSLSNNLQNKSPTSSTPTLNNGSTPTNRLSYDKLRNRYPQSAGAAAVEVFTNYYADRVTATATEHYSSPMRQKEIIDDFREKTLKLDHLSNINPKRLHINSKFFCRVHDSIDESGSFGLEVIYSKEDELKFREIFKLFRMCSKLSHPPNVVYAGKRVSALYKQHWHRAVIVGTNEDSSMVKVKFVDLGITKCLDIENELREIDEKFFNCPLKALQCTIRLNDSIMFTRDMRKLFRRLVYEKILVAQVVDLNQPNASCKIVLGCQFPKGFINVYWFILSKFNRIEYERVKLMSNLEKNSQSYIPTETTTTYSANTNERINNVAAVVHTTDLLRLDTLNEESIESLTTESNTSRAADDDSSINTSTLNDFTDLQYTTSFLNDDMLDDDSNQYGSDVAGDDVTQHYEDDDYVLTDKYLTNRVLSESFRRNLERNIANRGINNNNDTGLDYTPVKETHRRLNIEPVGIDSEAERNAAIQAAAVTAQNRERRVLSNQIPHDHNPLSSDTDTSIQVNCCANPLKWASSASCSSKGGGLFYKTKRYPHDVKKCIPQNKDVKSKK